MWRQPIPCFTRWEGCAWKPGWNRCGHHGRAFCDAWWGLLWSRTWQSQQRSGCRWRRSIRPGSGRRAGSMALSSARKSAGRSWSNSLRTFAIRCPRKTGRSRPLGYPLNHLWPARVQGFGQALSSGLLALDYLEGPPVCFEILISATPPFGNDLGGPSSTTQTPAIKFAENGHFDAIFSAPWIGYSASVQHGVPVGLRKPAKHPGCQAHALPSLRSRSGGQNLWLKKA
jgi:hypothetical protein